LIEEVRKQVCNLLEKDNSGHGMKHIESVLKLSLRFAEMENANKEFVTLIALLHDVDDHKLFGMENANHLTNARKILEQCAFEDDKIEQILDSIKTIGYSKRLKGITPKTLEASIVSDADMCDAIGAHGILRIYDYGKSKNRSFFDKDIFPMENITADNYKTSGTTSVNHIFEKILKLKNLMLTESGKEIAKFREGVIIVFLNNYFQEENNDEFSEWNEYLSNYIKEK